MPRPRFPNCTALPTNVIRCIREEQAYYDHDPGRAEREQATREEMRQEEERRRQEERWHNEQRGLEEQQQAG